MISLTNMRKNDEFTLDCPAVKKDSKNHRSERQKTWQLDDRSRKSLCQQTSSCDLMKKDLLMTQVFNAMREPFFAVNPEFRLVAWNSAFRRLIIGMGQRIENGHPAFSWDTEFQTYLRVVATRGFQGETFECSAEITIEGTSQYFLWLVAPLYNDRQIITEVAFFGSNATELMSAWKRLETLQKHQHQRMQEAVG